MYRIGKWFVIGWMSMWFVIQFLCHEWYTIFNAGVMGTWKERLNVFQEQYNGCKYLYSKK